MPGRRPRLPDAASPPAASARRTSRIALMRRGLRLRLRQEQGSGVRRTRRRQPPDGVTAYGIDVMTTETACLSSIWQTDEKVEAVPRRPRPPRGPTRSSSPKRAPYYDGVIEIDLSDDRADDRPARSTPPTPTPCSDAAGERRATSCADRGARARSSSTAR